jgi:hypothetical protein
MPFSKDTGVREHARYCSLCYKNGALCYQGTDRAEFQRICYQSMRAHGTNPVLARFYTFMIRFAPRWRNPQPSA